MARGHFFAFGVACFTRLWKAPTAELGFQYVQALLSPRVFLHSLFGLQPEVQGFVCQCSRSCSLRVILLHSVLKLWLSWGGSVYVCLACIYGVLKLDGVPGKGGWPQRHHDHGGNHYGGRWQSWGEGSRRSPYEGQTVRIEVDHVGQASSARTKRTRNAGVAVRLHRLPLLHQRVTGVGKPVPWTAGFKQNWRPSARKKLTEKLKLRRIRCWLRCVQLQLKWPATFVLPPARRRRSRACPRRICR